MRYNARSIIIRAVLIVFFLGIVVYGLFATRDLIRGPYIEISEPVDGMTTASSTVGVKGKVMRVSELTVNDSPVAISTMGDFEDTVLLQPGYNVLSIKVQDRFGKKIEKNLGLIRQTDRQIER